MPYIVDDNGSEIEIESLAPSAIVLLQKHYNVREVDEFQLVANERMLSYTFNTFVEKCDLYSSSTPADIVQFCEKYWLGIAYSTKHYALKNLALKFDSHNVRKELFRCIYDFIPDSKQFQFYDTFAKGEEAHRSFYEFNYINPTTRSKMIDLLREFDTIIRTADAKAVMQKLKNSAKLDIQEIHPFFIQLGPDKLECKFYACEIRE